MWRGVPFSLILNMLQLGPNGRQQKNSQQNWSSTFSVQGRTNGQSDKVTKWQRDKVTNPNRTGPPFQDLMSGWIQPESDNYGNSWTAKLTRQVHLAKWQVWVPLCHSDKRVLPNDSIFGERILKYWEIWENRGNNYCSQMNGFIRIPPIFQVHFISTLFPNLEYNG